MEYEAFFESLLHNSCGDTGFPLAKSWKADVAKMCSVVLDALIHRNGPQSHDFINSIESSTYDEWLDRLTDPVLFAWCTEAQKLSTVEAQHWDLLYADLRHDPMRVKPELSSPLVIWSRPSNIFLDRMRRSGPGSLGEHCHDAEFLDPSGDLFGDSFDKIGKALRVLAEVAPGFREDVDNFMRAIGLADFRASFRGSSALGRFGLVWYSPRITWSYQIWAEELMHEATHYILDGVGSTQPLLIGKAAEEVRLRSPLRADPRPAIGVFHALIVTGRILTLLDRLQKGGHEYSVLEERRQILSNALVTCSKEFLESVEMSVMGWAMYHAYVSPHLHQRV